MANRPLSVAAAKAAAMNSPDAAAWTDVLTLLQQHGGERRGAAYALAMASLKNNAEELDRQLKELAYAEERLLKHAREEADAAAGGASEPARKRGRSAAASMASEVEEANREGVSKEEPWAAAVAVDKAHSEALVEVKRQKKEQAEAAARAQAEAEARAKAEEAEEAERARKAQEAERAALLAQGLSSRCLPVRPGTPPCGFYLRRGGCKVGKCCMWDHPEPTVNSLGYPLRPGQAACAIFQRTHCCKFGAMCTLDHPEVQGPAIDQPGKLPLVLAKVAAKQQQMQLFLHLQLVQELSGSQDPETMTDVWQKFRTTFSLNA